MQRKGQIILNSSRQIILHLNIALESENYIMFEYYYIRILYEKSIKMGNNQMKLPTIQYRPLLLKLISTVTVVMSETKIVVIFYHNVFACIV